MLHTQQTELIKQIQSFFKTNYSAPANGQLEDDVKKLAGTPSFKTIYFR